MGLRLLSPSGCPDGGSLPGPWITPGPVARHSPRSGGRHQSRRMVATGMKVASGEGRYQKQ